MKISIVIPTYNSEKTIEQAILPLNNQTVKPYEIIVVDGRSSDSTPTLVGKHEDVKLICDEEENTAGSSRNLGARVAKGDIILFCDSDCIPDARLLEFHINAYMNKGDITGVKGTMRPVLKNEVTSFVQREVMSNEWLVNLNPDGTVRQEFGSYNFSIRREYFLKNPFLENLTSAEDVEFSIRIIDKGARILFEPRAVVYHHHPANLEELFEQRKWWGEGWFQLSKLDKKTSFLRKFRPRSFFRHVLRYIDLPKETLREAVISSNRLICEKCEIQICRIQQPRIQLDSPDVLNQVVCLGLASGVLKQMSGINYHWSELRAR